jgi:TolB-like protein/DNA-binding winged helix-turn-helix (wHTH) protein/Tfp pilus assembly protein PilF
VKQVTPPPPVRFGAFGVDPRAGELRKHGIRIKLREQPFQILLMLLERPGEVVTREELRAKLWPADTFVDFDHGLNAAVNKLREALGDSAEAPRYVETLPRRGYRFIGPRDGSTSSAEEAKPDVVAAAAPATPARAWRAGRAAAVAAMLIIAAGASYFAWRHPWRQAQPSAWKIMLVVLPFQNLSGDPGQDYFSDGLTEEMTTQLGSLQPERLGVIARTSAMKYKATQKSAAEIGQELRVDYVLEGSLRRLADRVRISAQLIQVKDQTHLWAKSYDRELGNILRLESEVAQAIAGEIRLKLTPQQQMHLAKRGPVNPEAYDSYLKGRYLWNMRTVEGLKKSVEYFQQAIEKDPGYALAYAGLADAYNILGNWSILPPKEAYPKAKAAARKALEIDDALAEAHVSLAFASYLFDWDWSAEEGFKRAIALNPNYGPAHQWYGVCLLSTGRVDEAIAEARRAREVEPFSLIINAVVGWVSFLGHRYDEAIEACRKTLEMEQSFPPGHEYLAMAYEAKGMYAEALAEFQNASRRTPFTLGALGHTYAMAGKKAKALKLVREMEERAKKAYFPPYQIALVYAGMGEKDQAFQWLEKAYEERYPWLIHLKTEPRFEPLHSDPRFQDLVRRIGLPQ